MVVSLVDQNRMSFKAFSAGCLKNDLRDFGWGARNDSSNPWVSYQAPGAQTKDITTVRLCSSNGSHSIIGQLTQAFCDVL